MRHLRSIRVKTEAAADDRWPTPFWSRPEKLRGEPVSLPATTPPIWSKPQHISTPLHLVGFAEPEPLAEQIDMWRNTHTSNGEFKKIQYTNEYNRLQKMVSKRKFKAHYADGVAKVTSARNTLIGESKKSERKRDIRAEWDTAIRVTFGHLRNGDIPESGFYILHRLSGQATTRLYLFLPEPSLKPDAWDQEEGPLYWTEEGGLESSVSVGKSEILATVREAAAKVRSKQVNEMTIRRNLGKRALYGTRQDVAYIRFHWEGPLVGGRLAWELLSDTSDTSDVSVSACF